MRRFIFIRFVVVCSSVLSASCFIRCQTKAEIRRAQEIDQLKRDFRETKTGQADAETFLDEMKTEMARTRTQMEEHYQHHQRETEAIKRELVALQDRLQTIEGKAREAQEKREERRISFEGGKALFDQGKYDEANEVFRIVMKNRANPEEVKKSHYWIGESYFGSKDYASAALGFSEFKKNYPKDPLVPNATYKQAFCFRYMGKIREAKLFYQELIERFPKHSLASKAKQEMKRLRRGLGSEGEEPSD